MKVKIWGARGSIPAPITPQTLRSKMVSVLLGLADVEREEFREELLSAVLALNSFGADVDESDEARRERQARRRQVIESYLTRLSALGCSTAGGNTPCVELRSGDDLMILDAGSGIRPLGLELMEGPCGRGQGVIHLFFSHPHWDHVQGFPFFRPAFVPGNQIFIYSVHDMEMALRRQQEKISFPVSLDYMQATMTFIRVKPGEVRTIGDIRVRNIRNHHPGDSYSFRFEKGDKTFVYATDASYPEGTDLRPYLNFFADADVAVFDSQFTQKESDEKEDWGHSSSFFGVEMAQKAGIKTLLLFHYDPTYTDEDLEKILADTLKFQQNQYPTDSPVNVLIAQEGQTFDLTPARKTQIQQVPGSKAAILKPTGIFDEHVAAELREQTATMADSDPPDQLIIDMTGVEMLQVAGLRALVKLRNDQRGIPMALAGPSVNVQQLIELAGYLEFFAIYPSVHAALNALKAQESMHLPGQVLKERYKIERKIGDGRLGTVFKAVDIKQNTPVALKVLSPSFSEGAIERFLRQAREIIDLIHPNIADVYDCDVDRGISFMAEEFVEGKTLRNLLDEHPGQPLPLNMALGIIESITRALEYAHARDIVHGDLKSKNILLSSVVKISDFGLGRLESGRSLLNLNVPLALVTARYLAPEQVLGHPLDARTDLYALGVIMYEMLTGRPPFEGTDQEVLEHHLNTPPTPPREFNAVISQSLEYLIVRLLDKDPNKRYATARQVRFVLNGMILISSGEVEPYPFAGVRWPALAGRQIELQQLLDLWQESFSGRGQIVLLNGESGIGRTRLIQEFISTVDEATVLIGQCQPLEGGLPYYPFVSALRSYFSPINTEKIKKDTIRVWQEIIQLVPETGHLVPSIRLPNSGEAFTQGTLSTLSETMDQATKKRPWLLVIDDLQWIDSASISLLNYLVHRAGNLGLMIVMIYDEGELQQKEALVNALERFNRLSNCTTISPGPLSQAETKELLEEIWSQSVPIDLGTAIYNRSAGNPLMIAEVARGLIDDGIVNWQEGRWYFGPVAEVTLPQNINEAVIRRFDGLDRETRTLLNQAAILGSTFKLEDLIEVTTLSLPRVLESMDIALERQFLEEVPGEQTLRFSHSLVRQTLYHNLSFMKRRTLHREAGELLERRYAQQRDMANSLAHHFLEAGELEKGLTYSVQAATQASGIYASQIALYWYTRALEIMDHLSDDRSIQYQSFEVLTARERLHNQLGQRQAQLADLVSLQHLAKVLNEPTKEAITHYRRSAYEQLLSRFDEAVAEAQAGLIASRQANNLIIESKSLLQLAQLEAHQGQFDQAFEYLTLAYDHSKKAKSQRTEAKILNGMGMIYKLLGDYNESAACYQKALAISQLVSDRHGQATYLSNLADILLIKGNYTRAEPYQQQALLLNQTIGLKQGEATSLYRLALIYKALGQYEVALRYANRAVAIHRGISDHQGEAADLRTLGAIYRLQSTDYVKSRDYIGQALEMAKSTKHKALVADTWLELGLVLEELGDYTKARQAYKQMQMIQNDINYKYGAIDAEVGVVRCLLREGNTSDAHQRLSVCLGQLASDTAIRHAKYPVRIYLTAYRVFTKTGDRQAAQNALQQAQMWLQTRAKSIENVDWKNSFLENIPDHRAFLAQVEQQAKSID